MTTRFGKWNRRDITIFLERLELYLSSGLTIDMALRLCGEGVSKSHKEIIEKILSYTESGLSLSGGLSKYMKLSHTLSGMIAHGEMNGDLVRAISTVRVDIEKQDELIKKCLGSMLYPCVILSFSIIFTIGLVRGVLPQIIPMLQGLHTRLPLLTRVMIGVSDFMMVYGLYMAILSIVSLSVAMISFKKSLRFRHFVQACVSRIPLIGNIFRTYNIVIFLRSLGSLVESGFSVPKAFGDSVSTLTFLPIKKSLAPKVTALSEGLPLGRALEGSHIAKYAVALIIAGESSGTLGVSILRVADIIDRDIEQSLKRLTTLIEPLMMIMTGLVVGSIALSILMPIYDLSKALQH